MKKVFMPSTDELYKMQDMGANVYGYILTKAIEATVCDGIGSIRGILSNDTVFEILDLEDWFYIIKSICIMYPSEIDNLIEYISYWTKKTELEQLWFDTKFCSQLLDNKNNDRTFRCNLDYLRYFGSSVTGSIDVFKKTILELSGVLKNNPQYRFEYLSISSNNTLLDDIFNCNIGENDLLVYKYDKDKIVSALSYIEPNYVIRFPKDYLDVDSRTQERTVSNFLRNVMNALYDRYNISDYVNMNKSEYYGKDILTNPDQNVKKLLKYINNRSK